jgi:hypothetical protein
MMAVALLVLVHEEDQMQRYKGSMSRQSAALDRNREADYEQLYEDYFHHTIFCSRRPFSCDAFGCQGKFSCVSYTE